MDFFQCQSCSKVFGSVKILILHLKHQHRLHRSGQHFKCMNIKCLRTFQTLSVFKRHLDRCYSIPDNDIFDTDNETLPVNTNFVDIISVETSKLQPIIEVHGPSTSNCGSHSPDSNENRVQEAATTLCAKLYSCSSLPRNLLQTVIEYFTEFINDGYIDIFNELLTLLKDTGISSLNNEVIVHKMKTLRNPFEKLSSQYLRIKLFKNSRLYMPPTTYVIGQSFIKSFSRTQTVHLESVNLTAQYMSIIFTLKNLLEKSGVLKALRDNVAAQKDYGEFHVSLLRGKLWLSKLAYLESLIGPCEVYPIIIYFDDFECGNPLGSHAGTSKIGAIYFTCPALPNHLLSRLSSIYTTLIFKSNDRYQCELRDILSPLINDLQTLETEGLTITVNGQKVTIRIMLLALVGDNLGVHSMLGYTESFSSNYFCRFCTCDKTTTKTLVKEQTSSVRSPLNYQRELDSGINEGVGLVKQYCVWNDIGSFHCFSNFACDPMHDILEGICRYEMSLIIHYFISVNLFNLETLNFRLKYFQYSSDCSNLPPPVKTEHLKKGSLIFSASEMYTLVKHFSLIVGDLIPLGNSVWLFFISLKKIVDFTMTDFFSHDSIQYFSGLVQSHLNTYLNLFKISLKPKHHLLLHYPRIMELMGPLKQFWCMRFEGKHRELKRYATAMTSRRNLPLSLAIKCQLNLCYSMTDRKEFLIDDFEFGPSRKIKSEILPELELNNYRTTLLYNWVKCKGITFKLNNAIALFNENLEVTYGKILYIIKCDLGNIAFILQNIQVVGFSEHYDYDEVNLTDYSYSLYKLPKIFSCRPLTIIKASDGNLYIPHSS